MPGSVLGIQDRFYHFNSKNSKYDLVIFAWQPWFLSPSIPATSLLHHPGFKAVIKDTPVITLIGARNMWLNAQEKVKMLLRQAGANWLATCVLTDRNQNFISGVYNLILDV
jgi:hypothetical protein